MLALSFSAAYKHNNQMDPSLIPGVISAASAAVDLFDKIADQVTRFITKRPDPTGPKEYRFKIQGEDGKIVVRNQGRELQTITGDDLKNLPNDTFQHIRVYEESMQRQYRIWQRVYPQRNSSPDPIVNAQVDEKIRDLILNMKDDLTGIVDFLQSIGVHLDDHYMMVRDIVRRYDGTDRNA